MIRRTAIAAAMLIALLAAPAAQADDASTYKAWIAENKTLSTHEDRLEKALNTWAKGGSNAAARERISKIRALLARRDKAVRAEATSSSKGAKGKSNALAMLRDYGAELEHRRAAVTGKRSQANARLKEYNALVKRARKYEDRAIAYFEDAGVA
jgi:predicted outer membrane protein